MSNRKNIQLLEYIILMAHLIKYDEPNDQLHYFSIANPRILITFSNEGSVLITTQGQMITLSQKHQWWKFYRQYLRMKLTKILKSKIPR